MSRYELSQEELIERLEYKNACLIGKYLEGQLFQGEAYIIAKLKEASHER